MRRLDLSETVEAAGEPRRAEPPLPAAPLPAAVLALQRGHGNAWVARTVAATLARLQDADREAFLQRGVMPGPDGLDFKSATGRGGFNVSYDPQSQVLNPAARPSRALVMRLAERVSAAQDRAY